MTQTSGTSAIVDNPDNVRIVDRRKRIAPLATDRSFLHSANGADDAKTRYTSGKLRAGIAFSGGGIRSATLSLGLAEGLISRGRFYGFDLMSTVSGGGYFGTFLRSLFIERELGKGQLENEALVKDREAFANAVLHSLPDQQYFRSDGHSHELIKTKENADGSQTHQTIKNPLWWLKENGRYLAPDGMTDYNFALAYIIRNWITLMFALLVGFAFSFCVIQAVLIGLRHIAATSDISGFATAFNSTSGTLQWSPVLALVPAMLLVWTGTGLGYWLSLGMKATDSKPTAIYRDRIWTWMLAIICVAAILLALLIFNLRDDPFSRSMEAALAIILGTTLITAICVMSSTIGLKFIWSVVRGRPEELELFMQSTRQNLAADFRRKQTRILAYVNYALLFIIAIGVIDTLALLMRTLTNSASSFAEAKSFLTPLIASSAVLSIIASLVAKLPAWLGGSQRGLTGFLIAHARTSALIAAIIMLVIIATLADMLVLKVVWRMYNLAPRVQIELIDWPAFCLFTLACIILVLLIGSSHQFLNQTALSPLYGSRLTRTYLGASNFHRLSTATPSEVTKGMLGDDISLQHYFERLCIAPYHLVNVTLNRTVGSTHAGAKIEKGSDEPLLKADDGHPRGRIASYESSLTLRDRKGDRMVFGPEGVRAGSVFFDWEKLGSGAQQLSLGQLCAVSGAAVSAGMGRRTSLGTAMALTLANVRMGQWWRQPDAGKLGLSVLFHSYRYLLCELLARFDRNRPYWQLSDGGHSENSGALSLLERDCEFILVSDNGEDPDFAFEDLEVFVRSARTDIGMEVKIASPESFPRSISSKARANFLNGKAGDWRARLDDDSDVAFALLLKAEDIWEFKQGEFIRPKGKSSWIIWLKPNRFGNLPPDLATYSQLNPNFPQQPTSNQFFDEAQWESYRRLGFEMGRRLFADDKTLATRLPVIFMDQEKLLAPPAPSPQ